jgi:hypothetical protein
MSPSEFHGILVPSIDFNTCLAGAQHRSPVVTGLTSFSASVLPNRITRRERNLLRLAPLKPTVPDAPRAHSKRRTS